MDLHRRHEELRLLEAHHYPRAAILRTEGVTSPENSVYPPNAFPWLWLLSPFSNFQWNQAWNAAWSFAALGVVLHYAWGLGASTSRLAALACMSAVLPMLANFSTFAFGQYGLIQIALMLGSTLALRQGRSSPSGLLFGIALFKPNNVMLMTALFLRERRYVSLLVASAIVLASAAAVSLWSGHALSELVVTTYPPGGMKFTQEGYSLVTIVSTLGVPPRTASLICAVAGFATLAYALRFVDIKRDPLLVFALIGCVTRISMYHRHYDDVLLVFLYLACLRLWIVAPSWSTTAVMLAMAATLNAPFRFQIPTADMIVWATAMIFFIVKTRNPPAFRSLAVVQSRRSLASSRLRAPALPRMVDPC